jgi:sulfite exporter TauE/SafE
MSSLLDVQLSLWAALVAGLAGSAHCLAMCGGLAGAMALRASQIEPVRSRLTLALVYNLARIASYSLAGLIAGGVGATVLHAVDASWLAIVLRVLAGFVMVAAAGRVAFGWRLLQPLEAAGSRAWRALMPRRLHRPGLGSALSLGLAWGALPCGLSYSMLLLAATTAHPLSGAVLMACFGLGTLPAMVAATVTFERAARALASRVTLRLGAGMLLLLFGAWTAGAAVQHGLVHTQHGQHSAGHAPGVVAEAPTCPGRASHGSLRAVAGTRSPPSRERGE